MELHELIWERLSQDKEIISVVTCFGHLPAIFTPEAPSDKSSGWHGKENYPRIVFTADLSADEERKCQGNMLLSIYAVNDGTFDFGKTVTAIKKCLCNVLLSPEEGGPYCLAWSRSDGFSIEGTNICGMELQFDILEYPCQETTDPDPIDALNTYLKDRFPEATVLWREPVKPVQEIRGASPVFYCRLERDTEDQGRSTFAVTWMNCSMAIHVFAASPEVRGKYTRVITKEIEMDKEFMMLDKSPFLVDSAVLSPSADYLRAGQIKVAGTYGLLRQTEKKKQIKTIDGAYHTGG